MRSCRESDIYSIFSRRLPRLARSRSARFAEVRGRLALAAAEVIAGSCLYDGPPGLASPVTLRQYIVGNCDVRAANA
jgi:hypothetical protein